MSVAKVKKTVGPRSFAPWVLGGVVILLIGVRVFSDFLGKTTTPFVLALAWREGRVVARCDGKDHEAARKCLLSANVLQNEDLISYEQAQVRARIVGWPSALGALSFAVGRDGVCYEGPLSERTCISPLELAAKNAYPPLPASSSQFTKRVQALETLLANRWQGMRGFQPKAPFASATRVRFERLAYQRVLELGGAVMLLTLSDNQSVGADATRAAFLQEKSMQGASYLVRRQRVDGTFQYLDHAYGEQPSSDYNWPRHAGTTWFLWRANRIKPDSAVEQGARKATEAMLRTRVSCGGALCLADGPQATLGSNALMLLALTEQGDLENAKRAAEWIVGLQKENGDFTHFVSAPSGARSDLQVPYYTGEAALGLVHFHEKMQAGTPQVQKLPVDTRYRDAALRAVQFLVTQGWSFPLARFYPAEEHWTCQAAAALERTGVPSLTMDAAYKHCLNWAEAMRFQQYQAGQAPATFVGCHGVSNVFAPKMTPTASRAEALVAIYAMAVNRTDTGSMALLHKDLEGSIACILRHQLQALPTRTGVGPGPQALSGGFVASLAEDEMRIDYTQHAGMALFGYANVLSNK
jgi:hypothetical protein